MKRIPALVLLASGVISISAAAQAASLDSIMKNCSEMTIVVNRSGERVGEKLGDYCAGYLEGVLDALKTELGADCKSKDEAAPEYLLSVLKTYTLEKKTPGSEPATKVIVQAFKRAFDCADH